MGKSDFAATGCRQHPVYALPSLPQKFETITATSATVTGQNDVVADATATKDVCGNASATRTTLKDLLSVAMLPSIILELLINNKYIYKGLIGNTGNGATRSIANSWPILAFPRAKTAPILAVVA